MNKSEEILNWWNGNKDSFPNDIPQYTEEQQIEREQEFETLISRFKLILRRTKGSYKMVRREKEALLEVIRQIFRSSFEFKNDEIELIFSAPMVSATSTFVRAVLKYEPDINPEAIFQALRNVWIMNGLQRLMRQKVELTPSVFGYSMLYPYTDNYLDDASISLSHKFQFVDRFADRLAGKHIEAENSHEERIFEMVELIEGEWERDEYPELYRSLLDIHAAQADSIRLMVCNPELGFEDRLGISIRKGAASVIADGYLLKGNLTEKEQTFLHGYGAYLQLLDDLQDLESDIQEGVWTAFAFSSKSEKLDRLLQQTYWFGENVIQQAAVFDSPDVPLFQGLMRRSYELFLVDAVRTNKVFFSAGFVSDFQCRLPFRIPYITKVSADVERLKAQFSNCLMREAIEASQSMEFTFLKRKSPLEQQA